MKEGRSNTSNQELRKGKKDPDLNSEENTFCLVMELVLNPMAYDHVIVRVSIAFKR